jgi:hypothetical protein
MNISYVKSIIERAKSSLKSSVDETYKEAIQAKIYDVEYNIFLDQNVSSINDLDDSYEIESYLEPYVKTLDESI